MIYITVAVDANNGIGKDGKLPWHLSKELAYFAKLTKPHTVIMGRTTWESIPEKFRPLPERNNIVLTKSNLTFDGAKAAHSLEEALHLADASRDIFIIGGAQVFAQAMKLDNLDGIYLTRIHNSYDCDTFLPEIPTKFKEEKLGSDEEDGTKFDYSLYKS